MRPVLLADITTAARALMPVAMSARAIQAQLLIARADAAHRFQDRTGRGHPKWGNGTLASMAMTCPMACEPCLDNADYLDGLIEILLALKRRQSYMRPDAQEMQSVTLGSSSSRFGAMSSPQASQYPNAPTFIRSRARSRA